MDFHFHIGPLDGLLEKVFAHVEQAEYDICVLGGDYCFWHRTDDDAIERMKRLAAVLLGKSDVYGLLGNHDRYVMAEVLDQAGVRMLVNDNVTIEKAGDTLTLIGVDDHHYFYGDDFDEAMVGVDQKAFKLLLCHSPEQYIKAAQRGIDVYLCGHTHGGQICLPNGFAPVNSASVPRKMLKGPWQYQAMVGYTSRGVGATGLPLRFYCPSEISLITLRIQDKRVYNDEC